MGGLIQQYNLRYQMYMLAALSALAGAGVIFFLYMFRGEATLDSMILEIIAFEVMSSLLIFTVAHLLGRFNGKRAEIIVAGLHAMAEGDLTRRIEIRGKDEFAWMCWEYSCARKGFMELVKNIASGAGHMVTAAEALSTITAQNSGGGARQQSEIQQVATAMEEMSATVHEVSKNAASAATEAQEADSQSKHGFQVVSETMDTIHSLADEVKHTADVIEKLKGDCISIGTVLDVIRDIAEQTNLLALNAAIEAARAGEQGRGFAVVADEVRTLASRTQQSTQEIHEMIERLQTGANQAVSAMEKGREKVVVSVEQAAKAGEALEAITAVVDRIKSMNMQIASAAEEQSATTEEINRNIVNISDVAEQAATGAHQTANSSDDLARLAVELQDQVGKFQVVN